jgi:hypothetical protein
MAIVVLRDVGTIVLDPRACNGTIYFELVLKDMTGQEVFSWTREHFQPEPNRAVLPRCTFMTTRLAPGESVQGTLDFRVAMAGMLTMSAHRFQAQTPRGGHDHWSAALIALQVRYGVLGQERPRAMCRDIPGPKRQSV